MVINVVLIKSSGLTVTFEAKKLDVAIVRAFNEVETAAYEFRSNLGAPVEAIYFSVDGNLKRYTLTDLELAYRQATEEM